MKLLQLDNALNHQWHNKYDMGHDVYIFFCCEVNGIMHKAH